MALTDAHGGARQHFATSRGHALCGLLQDVATTTSATQTTCEGCLRILISLGRDAEAVLQSLKAKEKKR